MSAGIPSSEPGPDVIYQVLIAGVRYGHVARCGCGWRAVHETKIAARASGHRHLRTVHGTDLPVSGEDRDAA